MTSKDANHDLWKHRLEEWQISGKTCATWAREKNLSYHALIYWRDKLVGKNANPSIPSFVELKDKPIKNSSLEIEVDGYVIRIHRNFDPCLLRSCIKCLKGITC